MLELNSCRPAVAQKLQKSVLKLEAGRSPRTFLEEVFSCYGLDFEINSNDFFNCDPSNVYELKGDYSQYGTGVTLESVGKSLDDLK